MSKGKQGEKTSDTGGSTGDRFVRQIKEDKQETKRIEEAKQQKKG